MRAAAHYFYCISGENCLFSQNEAAVWGIKSLFLKPKKKTRFWKYATINEEIKLSINWKNIRKKNFLQVIKWIILSESIYFRSLRVETNKKVVFHTIGGAKTVK